MPQQQRNPAGNQLLATLTAGERKSFLSRCEQVELAFGDALYKPGEPIRHVFFPTEGFVSLITPIEGHTGLEIGMVGSEGMLGTSMALGVDVARLLALVQGSGLAWQMTAPRFQREVRQSPALQKTLNRYLYVTLAQTAQTAACVRFHVVEARLARWLLMTRDRAQSHNFRITHEILAYILGVRRSGITQAAGSLQRLKLIHYSRGSIRIDDGPGLEAAACVCYAADKEIYSTMFA